MLCVASHPSLISGLAAGQQPFSLCAFNVLLPRAPPLFWLKLRVSAHPLLHPTMLLRLLKVGDILRNGYRLGCGLVFGVLVEAGDVVCSVRDGTAAGKIGVKEACFGCFMGEGMGAGDNGLGMVRVDFFLVSYATTDTLHALRCPSCYCPTPRADRES